MREGMWIAYSFISLFMVFVSGIWCANLVDDNKPMWLGLLPAVIWLAPVLIRLYIAVVVS